MLCLSNHYKVMFLLLVFWFSICFSGNTYADTCGAGYPATSSYGRYVTGSMSASYAPTPDTSCSQYFSASGFPSGWSSDLTSSTNCRILNVTGATAADLSIAFQTGFCPTGYTYDGTQCVNSCTPPADCPSAGTKKSASVALSGITGQAGISTTMCADSGGTNCGVSCSSGIASYNDVSGQSSVYCDSYTFTGSACSDPALVAAPVTGVPATNQATPVNSPPKTKQDCPGGSGFAEVNNVGMCLPSGTTYTGSSTTTTSTTGSVTTTSTTTVNQTGGNTTTTIKTHKDSGGNITYSGSTTDSPSINQLNSPGAGDKPSLGDAPTFDTTLPSEATFNIKAQGNPVFSTEIFASTASCPAPIAYAAMGQEFSIDFSGICALADIIRGIVLLLAAIVSMRSLVTN